LPPTDLFTADFYCCIRLMRLMLRNRSDYSQSDTKRDRKIAPVTGFVRLWTAHSQGCQTSKQHCPLRATSRSSQLKNPTQYPLDSNFHICFDVLTLHLSVYPTQAQAGLIIALYRRLADSAAAAAAAALSHNEVAMTVLSPCSLAVAAGGWVGGHAVGGNPSHQSFSNAYSSVAKDST
jgi:hypothetical protein